MPHRVAVVITALVRTGLVAQREPQRFALGEGRAPRVLGDVTSVTVTVAEASHTALLVIIAEVAAALAVSLAALRGGSAIPWSAHIHALPLSYLRACTHVSRCKDVTCVAMMR